MSANHMANVVGNLATSVINTLVLVALPLVAIGLFAHPL